MSLRGAPGRGWECIRASPRFCVSFLQGDGRIDVIPKMATQETGLVNFTWKVSFWDSRPQNRLLGFLYLFFFYGMSSIWISQENNIIAYLLYCTLYRNSWQQNNRNIIIINKMISKRASCFHVLFLVVGSFCPYISDTEKAQWNYGFRSPWNHSVWLRRLPPQ